MPNIPRNTPKRPWIAERKPFEGRVQSKFYYTALWKRVRIAKLMSQPLCRHCNEQGITTPATDVDHIHPINPHDPWDMQFGRYGHPVDYDNLQCLCKSCHASKTAASRGIEQR